MFIDQGTGNMRVSLPLPRHVTELIPNETAQKRTRFRDLVVFAVGEEQYK